MQAGLRSRVSSNVKDVDRAVSGTELDEPVTDGVACGSGGLGGGVGEGKPAGE